MMRKLFHAIIFVAITATALKAPCEMIGTKCLLKNIYVTKENFTSFSPIATPPNDPKAVDTFQLTLSNIEILTGDICIALSRVIRYRATFVGIIDIHADAFGPCAGLKLLDLTGNRIERLAFDLFVGNKHLEAVLLGGNQLKELDAKLLYPIWQLRRLEVQNNLLKTLPVVTFMGSKSIETLMLQSNCLTDLEESALIKTIPNLRLIYLADNDFACKHLEDMLPTLRRANVSVSMFYDNPRPRSGNVSFVDGSPCLNNDDEPLKTQVSELKKLDKKVEEIHQTLKSLQVFQDTLEQELTAVEYLHLNNVTKI